MRRTMGRRLFLGTAWGGICLASGCGTILYPERRGQPVGQLDWGVVLLDGIGLFLFFVPGVIAFAVDFATGSIFLPPEQDFKLSASNTRPEFKTVKIAADRLSPDEIAKAVSAETGQAVRLESGRYFTAELSDLDNFWPARERLAASLQVNDDAEVPQAPSS